jgi:cation transport protein ChaC
MLDQRCARNGAGRRRPVGVRLCVADLAARVRRRRAPHAVVHGWHRALRMRSRVNRGTPEPGPGVRAAARRQPAAAWSTGCGRPPHAELDRLWAREMPTGVYDPRWLPCRTPQGAVQALAFTLSRRSEACLPPCPTSRCCTSCAMPAAAMARTLDYLAETACRALSAHGVRDREIERLMRLARRHGLVEPGPQARSGRSGRPAATASAVPRAPAPGRPGCRCRPARQGRRRSPHGPDSAPRCGARLRRRRARSVRSTARPRTHRVAAPAAVLREGHRCSASASATARMLLSRIIGMSPGRTSQPSAAGRSDTPAAMEWPTPRRLRRRTPPPGRAGRPAWTPAAPGAPW